MLWHWVLIYPQFLIISMDSSFSFLFKLLKWYGLLIYQILNDISKFFTLTYFMPPTSMVSTKSTCSSSIFLIYSGNWIKLFCNNDCNSSSWSSMTFVYTLGVFCLAKYYVSTIVVIVSIAFSIVSLLSFLCPHKLIFTMCLSFWIIERIIFERGYSR